MKEILFLREETRLSILCLLIEIYNQSGVSYFCIEFDYIEKVAEKFEMQDRLGEAAYFGKERACSILANEKREVIFFYRELMQYLIHTEKTAQKAKESEAFRRRNNCFEPCVIRELGDMINKDIVFSYVSYASDPLNNTKYFNIASTSNHAVKEHCNNSNEILFKDL